MIHTIYTSPAENVVIQHRRILTPFFWFRLKPKTFTKKPKHTVDFFGIPVERAECWEDGRGTLCPYEIIAKLEAANTSHTVIAFPSKQAKR